MKKISALAPISQGTMLYMRSVLEPAAFQSVFDSRILPKKHFNPVEPSNLLKTITFHPTGTHQS